MRSLLLILIYVAVASAPLCLAWLVGGAPRSWPDELASGLGMLAFAMILAEFVLSGRFKRISREIGMDATMRFHQLMARAALAFALLHPFLYRGAPAGGPRPWDPDRQLTIATDPVELSTGIAAFLVLPAFIGLAIGRKHVDHSYETWRLVHGLGALLIAGLLLDHTLSVGRYAARPELEWLWIAMTGLAAGSLLFVYVIAPLRRRRRAWRVASLSRLTPRQWELTVSPDGHDGLHYDAGQFAWLNVGHSAFSLKENPFSISSAPATGPNLSFLIKELGDFTRSLGAIRPGTRAYIDGPFGNLTVEGRAEPGIALIAGGVGLAPLLGILRQLRAAGDPRKVRLVYGNRLAEQIVQDEAMQGQDVIHVLSEPTEGWHGETGVIDAALIDRVFSPAQLRDWLFVLCGPKPMLDAVESHLIRRGTPSRRILSERFDYD